MTQSRFVRCFAFPIFAFFVLLPSVSQAQLPNGWKAHDKTRPAPPEVDPGEDNTTRSIPSDAIVLFDGSNLDAWRSASGKPIKWKIVNGALESVKGGGILRTKAEFGDCQIHVEWTSPTKPSGKGQGRGNSGVFLMGKFEVQVLDSFKNPTYADGSAGSIYGQHPPLVNVSRGPGEWQAYDIIFKTPRFDESGKLTSPAVVTVMHNGVVIQHATEPFGPTDWILHNEYKSDEVKGPLAFQDHGNPVRYRNVWVRNLKPRPAPTTPYPQGKTISEEQMAKVVGKYGREKVTLEDGKLYLHVHRNKLEMIALENGEFALKKAAGTLKFDLDESGKSTGIDLQLDCGKQTKKGKAK